MLQEEQASLRRTFDAFKIAWWDAYPHRTEFISAEFRDVSTGRLLKTTLKAFRKNLPELIWSHGKQKCIEENRKRVTL